MFGTPSGTGSTSALTVKGFQIEGIVKTQGDSGEGYQSVS